MSQLSQSMPFTSDIDNSDTFSSFDPILDSSDPPPDNIERIWVERVEYARLSKTNLNDFLTWWATTQFGSQQTERPMNWGQKRLQSDIWEANSLDQIAHLRQYSCISINTTTYSNYNTSLCLGTELAIQGN